jgi:hypothetical protein
MRLLTRTCLVAVVALAAISGCAGVSFNSAHDPSFDFSTFKTFAIELGPAGKGKVAGVNAAVVRHVENAVSIDLRSKAFEQKQTSVGADFIAVLHGGTQEQTADANWGYGGWWGTADVDDYNYAEGALVIDIVDMSTRTAVWRGTGTGIVGQPALSQEEATELIGDILATFPPKPTGTE